MRLIAIFAFALALMTGCGSNPILLDSLSTKQGKNKYCLLLPGKNSTFAGRECKNDELDAKSTPIRDDYINSDMVNTMALAESKGFTTTIIKDPKHLSNVIGRIAFNSDDSTQLLIAMSGECDDKGFIFNLVHMPGMNLVPPGMKLMAKDLIEELSYVRGTKAIIINGCQSGCFVDSASKSPDFKGVVIAACPVGYATTECQRTGTSAVYAGFLGLYRDDPQAIKNLATEKISAGFWFENIRHKISDIGAGGLPISYDVVRYSSSEFLF